MSILAEEPSSNQEHQPNRGQTQPRLPATKSTSGPTNVQSATSSSKSESMDRASQPSNQTNTTPSFSSGDTFVTSRPNHIPVASVSTHNPYWASRSVWPVMNDGWGLLGAWNQNTARIMMVGAKDSSLEALRSMPVRSCPSGLPQRQPLTELRGPTVYGHGELRRERIHHLSQERPTAFLFEPEPLPIRVNFKKVDVPSLILKKVDGSIANPQGLKQLIKHSTDRTG